tara:strand:+ start:98 stop:607 length:510 start_codon:yes stop_codon:yes gene_type:complete
VTQKTAGAVTNTASVRSDETKTDQKWESPSENNDDAHTVTVLTLVDLAVTKKAFFTTQLTTTQSTANKISTVNLSDGFFHKINVENTTATQGVVNFGEASSVYITDTWPVGTDFTADPTFKADQFDLGSGDKRRQDRSVRHQKAADRDQRPFSTHQRRASKPPRVRSAL